MAIPVISLGSKFDAKGFRQAETSLDKLNKNAKSLARTFGLTFGTAAVIAFGKASVKAFAEDEAAAVKLTKAVENLGLGFDNARITRFISDLEATAAVADDVLRPAFQSLISTTGSVTQSQNLLALALDISAGTGIDAAQVSKDLGLAYLGQTKGLAKYNTGLSKTELTTAGFLTLQEKLTTQYSGQNAARLDTYAGKVGAVNIAYGNLQETIGGALIDSFAKLAGDTTTEDLTESVDNLAESLAAVIELVGQIASPFVGLAKLINSASDSYVKFLYKATGTAFMGKVADREYGGAAADAYRGIEEKANAEARAKAEALAVKRAKELAALTKKTAASNAASLKSKQLQLSVDKAQLLLGKGGNIFDLDAIQINAALINQADQLGKTTNAAQLLAIANDVARLNVKKSMYELEQAIASGDIKAIESATAKLNKDLQILSALTGQSAKMADIKSILDSLKPKDLINIDNLNTALLKIQEMLNLLKLANAASTIKVATSSSLGSGIPVGDYIAPIDTTGGSIDAILEYADAASARANAFADLLDQQNYADYLGLIDYQKTIGDMGGYSPNMNSGAGYGAGNTIIVNTGVGDPNAIAEAIDQVLTDAVQRGTLRGGAY